MEAGVKEVRILANRAKRARRDAKEWRDELNRGLRRAAEAGCTLRELAKASDLSFQRIGQILSEGD
jgi:hypothetical protein